MNNTFRILPAYAPLFWSDRTYFLISGGRASGKSTQVAAYFILKLFGSDYFRGVIARYTAKSLTHSIYMDILDLMKQWNVRQLVQIKGDTIVNPGNDNMILCHAMKLAEGAMTAKGKGLANVTHLLIDEATELVSEDEYIKLIDSFRYKGAERKIFLCFNPTSKSHFIFKRWYLPDGTPNTKWTHDHYFLHTTYHDNINNIDPSKIEEWERMKSIDPDYYDHHILGLWRDLAEGSVYSHFQFDYQLPDDGETIYGLDFGFSSDPTALIRLTKKGHRIWVKELLYKQGLTNQDIGIQLQQLGVSTKDLILADSAEPKSIEELKRLGFNVRPAVKGPDSVRHGIQKVKSYEIHVDPMSKNLIEEYNNYTYREGTDSPRDAYNHLMDALRYALSKDGPSGKYGFASSKRNDFEESFHYQAESIEK